MLASYTWAHATRIALEISTTTGIASISVVRSNDDSTICGVLGTLGSSSGALVNVPVVPPLGATASGSLSAGLEHCAVSDNDCDIGHSTVGGRRDDRNCGVGGISAVDDHWGRDGAVLVTGARGDVVLAGGSAVGEAGLRARAEVSLLRTL